MKDVETDISALKNKRSVSPINHKPFPDSRNRNKRGDLFSDCPLVTAWFDIAEVKQGEVLETVLTRGYPELTFGKKY